MTGGLQAARLVVIDRDNSRCVVCGLRFEEVHHRFRRGMGGSKDPDIHNPVNLLCLCGRCHNTAERFRVDASARGVCVPNLPAVFVTPVLTFAGWQLPTIRGTWLPIGPAYMAADAESAGHLGRTLIEQENRP